MTRPNIRTYFACGIAVLALLAATWQPSLAQGGPWDGKYSNPESTYTVTSSGASVNATSTYTPSGTDHAKQGSEDTFGCTIDGSRARCANYSGRYWDDDKTITYSGNATLALSGSSLSVSVHIDSANISWKKSDRYTPAIHPGADFFATANRVSGGVAAAATATAVPTATPQPAVEPTLTPTSTPMPEPEFFLTAFLDCGNVVGVQVGPPNNPGQSTPCDLVIDGFKTNTSAVLEVIPQNTDGEVAELGGLIPHTGIVVFPGVFTQDPSNQDKPYYAGLFISACPQTNLCDSTLTPTDPTTIRFRVRQAGVGEVMLDITIKPVASGNSTRVAGCAFDRGMSLIFTNRDGAEFVHFNAQFASAETTSISYMRLELSDENGTPLGGGSPVWESVPNPLNPGTSDPRTERNLLHVIDGMGNQLTNPVGQVGWVGPVGIPAGVITNYELSVMDPDGWLNDGQMVLITVYLGDPFSLDCKVGDTTPVF